MPNIGERIAAIEERTISIQKSLEEIKDLHCNHLDRCHNTMQPLIEESRKNTIFREISVWILTSSGILGFLGGMAWIGIKLSVKANV